MDGFIRVGTAHTFQMGPFLDETDGKTPETGLTIAAASILLSKHGAAFGAKNDATALTGTGDSHGYYDCVLNTTDTGTVGCLKVETIISGALPVWHTFVVLPALIYDSLIAGSDNLQTHMVEVTNDIITAAAIANGAIDMATLASDLKTGSAIKANVETVTNGAITAAAIADAAIDLATFASDVKTGSALKANVETVTAGIIANASFNADVGSTAYATNIIALAARKVLDALNLDHLCLTATGGVDMTSEVADGTILSRMMSNSDTSLFVPATHSMQVVGADVAAVHVHAQSVIDELAKVPKSDSNVSWNATALGAINAEVDTALNTAIPASNTADSVNDILLDQLKAKFPTNYIMGSSVQTAKDDEIDAILEDTGTSLPATLVTIAGYIDTEVGTLGTELAKVPKSDSNVSWNATALGAINAEVDTALNTAIPGSPTSDSINERIVAIDAYGAPPAASAIKTAIEAAGSHLALILEDTGTTIPSAISDLPAASDIKTALEASGSLLWKAFSILNNKMNVTDADGTVALRAIGDGSDIASGSVTDNSTTTTRAELVWA